ncbi:hydrogenase nickel incorporation protein HypA [Anoxybacillus gonensis]|uniref:Hydrogenase maturation factor HypA n=1 Tax=Anoxybacillus gonensis TaxID=198467 RepID=A0AAW7TJ13_9BACL|nr:MULTISPECIES: hydrogenase maturation nickel metallochaperone HypA [Anoxybacillus]AXM90386.1 hydrogenase nickel incorporation protein HypA [Anoxybacillus ayderensis G10]THD17425.1 hydrogenase nickel incorporation protein HypA [Anoxybacillus ayderensis]AKS38330.1 hydrogenase nickel incorporation protein HypA [Anoxybacillus gonensis]EMI10998.1 hydrogenase expression/synthesis HypA [Anoxybacillus gonensis]KGP60499.1 hydrogenase nickel incorporation protein HypA [Anoxybacillus gonensis]
MHEMALMGEIVQLIEQDAQLKQVKYVKKVELLVGTLSNVLPDALQFAFDVYKMQTNNCLTTDAELIIHIEKAKAVCAICGSQYEPVTKIAQCPACLLPSGNIVAGETFRILAYEGSSTDENYIGS